MISDLIAAFENLRSEKIQQARSRRRVERVMVANIKSWQVNRTKMTGLGHQRTSLPGCGDVRSAFRNGRCRAVGSEKGQRRS